MDAFFSNEVIMSSIESLILPEKIIKLRSNTSNERILKKIMSSAKEHVCAKIWTYAPSLRSHKVVNSAS
jgi:hypothetical protein